MDKFQTVSSNFLELASEQRLRILSSLDSKPHRVSGLAKKLDVTAQEIHRNLDRLSNSGFVRKGTDEHFHITTMGRLMLSQMPLMFFVSKNKKYFSSHDIGVLPTKFSRRLGVLENCECIKGVTNVLNRWRKIYVNSKEYVCDLLNEFPPGMDEILLKRVKNGAKYRHIVNNNPDEHDGRVENLKKLGYYDLIQQKKIERRKLETTGVVLILNEKEGGIIFPSNEGEPDLRYMFYSNDRMFQDWCKDYFEFYWKKAKIISRIHPMLK